MAQGSIIKDTKDGGKRVVWRVRLDGGTDPSTGKRRQTMRSFPTRAEAQRWLAEQSTARANGTFADAGRLTVGAYLNDWLAGRKDIRASSRIAYAALLKSRIVPGLGAIPLRALRPAHVARFLADQEAAPATVNVLRAILGRAFEDARRGGLLAINPARDLASLAKPERAERALKHWDGDQARAFLRATAGDPHAMLWRLLLASGLRIGEALALRWEDVDLPTGTIQVRRTLSRVSGGHIAAPPKTTAGRRAIPLDPATTDALRTHRQAIRELRLRHADLWEDRDLVFPQVDGSFHAAHTLRATLGRLCVQHGLPVLGLHGLRHTHATLLLASGIAPKIASERLGHTTVGQTLDTYSHVTGAMQEEAAKAIGAALG